MSTEFAKINKKNYRLYTLAREIEFSLSKKKRERYLKILFLKDQVNLQFFFDRLGPARHCAITIFKFSHFSNKN